MIVFLVENDPNHAAELIWFPPFLFCMSYCWKTTHCVFVYRKTNTCSVTGLRIITMQTSERKNWRGGASFNPFSYPCTRDWWLRSGFLHTTNWIHRSLDKVHKWDCSSLKTGVDRQENREGCERGNIDEVVWFRTNKISSPSAVPPKPLFYQMGGGDR